MSVAILHPGSMGGSLGWAIHTRSPAIPLYTCLEGRSKATLARAASAGLTSLPMEDLVAKSSIIISILPPSEATKLAQEVIQLWSYIANKPGAPTKPPIYVDANAVSPATTAGIAALLAPAGIPFVDGCVIGGPARDGYDPKVYISASPENEPAMEEVFSLIGDGKGLLLKPMRGAGLGAASALKMSYAGFTKGSTGLATAMVLSASKHSQGTADALIAELKSSQPAILNRACSTLEGMLPKAYRWVGEMEEIADYIANPTGTATTTAESETVTDALAPTSPSKKSEMADTYRGIAQAFELVARDLEKGGEGDVKLLKAFLEKGRKALEG